MQIMKSFRLAPSLAKKLSFFSKKMHRTEKFFIEEALKNYFLDYEDALIAQARLKDPAKKIISSKEMRNRLNV